MSLDWSQCPAVESVPGKVSGAWVLRGQFAVTREQIDSVMAFVARSLEKEPTYR